MLAQDAVAAVRRFNRFYTRRIGALDDKHLGEPYSLAESRVLYEVAQSPTGVTPKSLAAASGLDAGYLSRILKKFEREGVMIREPSPHDGRSISVWLTSKGIVAYNDLRQTAEAAVEQMIADLPVLDRARLTAAMAEMESLLGAPAMGDIMLRDPQVGDMGWVVHRHAVLYAREYGWGARFEALVAGIVEAYVLNRDPAKERCWIAERGGEPVGSIFLVKGEEQGQAKLRLLLIEPSVRGMGLGKRLVAECVAFARQAGYREITLWTQDVLAAARGIYAGAGFQLTRTWPHSDFGPAIHGETWTLRL